MGLFRFRKKKEAKQEVALSTVQKIKQVAQDAVEISFSMPNGNTSFIAGQYVNLTVEIDGEKVIRSYSICSGVNDELVAIGVKKVPGGKMSTYLVDELKEGDQIEVSEAQGNFKLDNDKGSFVAFVAGSGITPVLSMIKSSGQEAQWKVYFGNKNKQHIMFYDDLTALQNDNIEILHYLSQSDEAGFHQGRLTEARIKNVLEGESFDGVFLCGPEGLIKTAVDVAAELNIDKERVHYELFTTPVLMKSEKTATSNSNFTGNASCKVIIDGEQYDVFLKEDEIMLDAFEREGIDAPFSCKGAVCCTCRAKVTEGSAEMVMNYSLGDGEVADGYVLTCQAKATSEKLTVNFDA